MLEARAEVTPLPFCAVGTALVGNLQIVPMIYVQKNTICKRQRTC
jgi:hypothetical protein